MVGAFVLYRCYCISMDFNSSAGILYLTCCLLANWEIYHTRGTNIVYKLEKAIGTVGSIDCCFSNSVAFFAVSASKF